MRYGRKQEYVERGPTAIVAFLVADASLLSG